MRIKSLILSLLAVAVLAFGLNSPVVAADYLTGVFNSVSSNQSAEAPMLVAVDNQISALCRAGADSIYQRPGGYCDQVASNKSLVEQVPAAVCDEGEEPNPNPPPACIVVES